MNTTSGESGEMCMVPSLIMNALNFVFVLGSVLWGMKKAKPRRAVFRYFTTLSNVLCALASLVLVVLYIFGKALPFWALLLKYAGTAAVSVTMLTVFLFLGPTSHDWKGQLTGPVFFLHLLCPLLAIVSLLVFEKNAMPAWIIPIGVLPVILYGILYMSKVLKRPEPVWEDFYGFNRGGKWKISFLAMTLAAAVIAFALWLV